MTRQNTDIQDNDILIIGGSEWKGDSHQKKAPENRKWKIAFIVLSVLTGLIVGGYLVRHLVYQNKYPKSRSDKALIEALQKTRTGPGGIIRSLDESMGVELKIYEICGLSAQFADTVPPLTDPSIYFVTRSADYRIENEERRIIGDFIQDGEVLAKSRWRAGFMAIADGNAQIGISRGDRVRRYVLKEDGSFFRQFALVSAGVLCPDQGTILRGKVSRCAYARDEKGRLFFVETVHAEALPAFADALREYGFIDAVYVTGGRQADLFFRTSDGTAHGTYTDDKPHKLVVWKKNQ